jgi:hypothetical protein
LKGYGKGIRYLVIGILGNRFERFGSLGIKGLGVEKFTKRKYLIFVAL